MEPAPLYLHVQPEAALPTPPFTEPYRAVVVADTEVSAQWMATVSAWLVESGCLYAMGKGSQGAKWETAIDTANIEEFNFGEIPEKKFVMTTWHNDSLEEVFWFCKNNAHHPTVALHRTLVLHISAKPAKSALLRSYDEA
jgi:hypothetical protein